MAEYEICRAILSRCFLLRFVDPLVRNQDDLYPIVCLQHLLQNNNNNNLYECQISFIKNFLKFHTNKRYVKIKKISYENFRINIEDMVKYPQISPIIETCTYLHVR